MTSGGLEQALTALYGIETVELRGVRGGQDFGAQTHVAVADGGERYFVKTRATGEGRDVGAAVLRHLHEAGLQHVLAPLPSLGGELTPEHDGLSLAVYRYVEARPGADVGLSDAQWRSFGELVGALHRTRLPLELEAALPRERYRPAELDLLPHVDRAASDARAVFWTERRATTLEIAERAEELGPRLAERELPFVLCHADLHTWNVLVDRDEGIWVVDWDEVVLAPKERDLMFVVGGIGAGLVSEQQTACFFAGYGECEIDSLALAYYRHAWAVQDVVGYAARLLLEPSLSDDVRAEAARLFVGLFEPGEIVELARATPG